MAQIYALTKQMIAPLFFSVYRIQMNPLRFLFVIFIVIPVLEIYLLIQVGSLFGAFTTALLVVTTAVIGAWLLRLQGFSTWQRVQKSMNQGELPAIELVEGLILLVSGALLLTPGFFTDAVGFFCLVPPFRQRVALFIIKNGAVQGMTQKRGRVDGAGSTNNSDAIEGEFKREE